MPLVKFVRSPVLNITVKPSSILYEKTYISLNSKGTQNTWPNFNESPIRILQRPALGYVSNYSEGTETNLVEANI
jgi:hypothetical protein